jgi:transcription termination factor NusB
MQIDKRTKARELAMQALYQLDVQGTGLLQRLEGEFFGEAACEQRTRRLAWEWTQGT